MLWAVRASHIGFSLPWQPRVQRWCKRQGRGKTVCSSSLCNAPLRVLWRAQKASGLSGQSPSFQNVISLLQPNPSGRHRASPVLTERLQISKLISTLKTACKQLFEFPHAVQHLLNKSDSLVSPTKRFGTSFSSHGVENMWTDTISKPLLLLLQKACLPLHTKSPLGR